MANPKPKRAQAGQSTPAAPLSATVLARLQKRNSDGAQDPPPKWWSGTLPELLREWGAFGAHLGHKTVAGQRRAQLSLVVQTLSKGMPRRGSGIRKVPIRVRWRDGRMSHSLVTDVLECSNKFKLQAGAVFGPGDTAAFGSEFSTIGAAVSHPTLGRCLLTAGHLLPDRTPLGSVVSASASGETLTTTLSDYARSGSLDYAVLAPVDAAPLDNLVRDLVRIGPVYTPSKNDVGTRVRVVRNDGMFHETVCRGVHEHFTADDGTEYVNVILTDAVTASGDSGGPLVDEEQRVWGFLLGVKGDQWSAFVPAFMVLHAAGVSFS